MQPKLLEKRQEKRIHNNKKIFEMDNNVEITGLNKQ